MLFHVKQVHTPDNCPYGRGGSPALYDATAAGVKVVGIYGAFMAHTIYYILDADDIDALNAFLLPGLKACTTTITPVSDHPIPSQTTA